MRSLRMIVIVAGLFVLHIAPFSQGRELVSTRGQQRPTFEERLETRIEHFDNERRPLTEAAIDIAYRYELPMGLEYVNREAVTRPLTLRLRNTTIRETLSVLVAQAPEYRVAFSGWIVQIYSPSARADPSNLLNTVIDDFGVDEVDSQVASSKLFGALVGRLEPRAAVFESTAVGSLGESKVTLRLQKARVFEILNAITAKNGRAVWVVRAPPQRLSTLQDGARWYIYSLDPAFKDSIIHDLRSLFPETR